jgi:hypothetical protein
VNSCTIDFFFALSQEVKCKLAGFVHVAHDLHLALRERDLRIQLAHEHRLEVGVLRCERDESGQGSTTSRLTLIVLQVDIEDERGRRTFLGGDLEFEDRLGLGDENFAETAA